MTWSRYAPAPTNQFDPAAVINSPAFAPAVLRAIQDPRIAGYLVPRSIPQRAVDIPVVTDLPVNPQDGDEVFFLAEPTISIVWRLRYRAATPSRFRWEYAGGSELRAENAGTSMTTISTSYTDLSTVGPSITVKLPGDYRIQWGWQAQHSNDAGVGYMGIKVGSASTADSGAVRGQAGGVNYDILSPNGNKDFTIGADDVVKAQYRTLSGTLTVNNAGVLNPWMMLRPVRVARRGS